MTNWASKLKDELRERAVHWAAAQDIPHYSSLGDLPTVLFPMGQDRNSHGNFHPNSWRVILASDVLVRRLDKPHAQAAAALPVERAAARELDSSNSSDALLMNCFCFPGAAPLIMKGLGLWKSIGSTALPEFGVKAKLPKTQNRQDATELDMRIGPHIFEAKLTESDFVSKPVELVREYVDFSAVFDDSALPVDGTNFEGYQLIRNVLAAFHLKASLTVLLDQRRPDLLQEWWAVHAAIKSTDLRLRCGFRTWQQVAASSPAPLAAFLSAKYGI
jgi:hypothetical protein